MQETTNIAGNTAHIAGSNPHCRKHCPHCRKQPSLQETLPTLQKAPSLQETLPTFQEATLITKHCQHCRKQPAPHKPNNFTIIAPLCQNTFRFYSNDQASPQHFLQRLPEINFYAKTPKNVPGMLFLQKHLKTSQDIPRNASTRKHQQPRQKPIETYFQTAGKRTSRTSDPAFLMPLRQPGDAYNIL